MKSSLQALFLGVAFGLFSGCNTSPQSNYDAVTLVDVSGTVTLDDKPLANAVVRFESADGQYSSGMTDADGKYALQFDSVKSGVTPGEKTVRISTSASIGEEGEGGEGESQTQKKTELVPEKYNKKSELKETVEASGSQTFNFDLKTKG